MTSFCFLPRFDLLYENDSQAGDIGIAGLRKKGQFSIWINWKIHGWIFYECLTDYRNTNRLFAFLNDRMAL